MLNAWHRAEWCVEIEHGSDVQNWLCGRRPAGNGAALALCRKARSALLEHDEAITLLAAAGKSERIDELYASLDRLNVMKASDLQALMKPSGDTGFSDVWNSVVRRDVHPPLYFWLVHAVERLTSATPGMLRAIGFFAMLAAAAAADRWIWPDASLVARLAAFGMLIAGPVWLELATELRQYALVTLGTVLTIAALARLDRGDSPKAWVTLMVAACVGLVWTHLGSVVWVGIMISLAGRVGPRVGWRRLKPLLIVVLVVSAMLVPLALADWNSVVTGRASAVDLSLNSLSVQAMQMTQSLRRAFLPLPMRLEVPAVSVVFAVLVVMLAAWFAQSERCAHRGLAFGSLLWAALLWTIAWLVGLAMGKIPEHAAQPKYLTPLLLSLLAITVRATASQTRAKRQVATAMLLLVFVASPVGWAGLLPDSSASARHIDSIGSANALLVDQPKRGQLLPIVSAMRPDAKIIIAKPTLAASRWNDFSNELPIDRLLVLEIDPDRSFCRHVGKIG
ncbi:MAG: hypothetical protein IPK83_21970 [Planctomycetes bacterium]|nr:hypothetical protein [Planctomycetota bacterium]